MTDDATPPRSHERRNAALILLSIAVVAALVVGGFLIFNSKTPKHAAAPPPTDTSAVTTSPAPSPTHSRTPAPKPKPKPVIPHDVVAAAAPTSFVFTSKSFTIKATVCGMENIRPLDPPGEQHHTVCWVQHDFGYAPASKGRGTTYVLGHAWAEDSLEVLNKISEAAMRQVLPKMNAHRSVARSGVPTYPFSALDGAMLTLRTPAGVLTYRVRDGYAAPKEQAGYINHLVDENVKNRVVLITCGELNHVDYDVNIVLEAYLYSSKATRATT